MQKGRSSFRFFGPGLLVAVGYMDPGNWATDIAAGSHFGYSLLFVVFSSGIVGMILQFLSIKLTIATNKDLSTLCASEYSKPVRLGLWVTAEIGIIACDLAEVLGAAIALNLLFGLPLIWGSMITILDTFLVLFLVEKNVRYLEAFILVLMGTITFCFLYNFFVHPPDANQILAGLAPPVHLVTNPQALLISAGILGATVMPHNLYLHGYAINTKLSQLPKLNDNIETRRSLLRIFAWDSHISLAFAFIINAFILILSASHFSNSGAAVDSIENAYKLLSPTHLTAASILFAVALLASGQNATFTGTIAADAIMQGFLKLKLSPALIRLITRSLALIPIVLFLAVTGSSSVDELLVLSQVVLSFQLPFVAIPLLQFTNSKKLMGSFANQGIFRWICGCIVAIILALNILLIFLV